MQHFAPHMPPGSSIVNILSIAAKTGFANWSAYCMSKFALEGCSQCVREELRDRRIRMINVYPAATDTHIWTHIEGKWPRHKMISPEEVASAVAYALSQPANVALENITISAWSDQVVFTPWNVMWRCERFLRAALRTGIEQARG
jgi:NAD(P)-dependent dehydrogenase (short-subunit alcohol dehydrogenase family)